MRSVSETCLRETLWLGKQETASEARYFRSTNIVGKAAGQIMDSELRLT